MGTSNMYKGPKKNILLPSGYSDPDAQGQQIPDSLGETSDDPENHSNDNNHPTSLPENSVSELNSGAKWQNARRTLNRAIGGNRSNLKSAASAYTKALGGYKTAAGMSNEAKHVTRLIFSLFEGSNDEIRRRLLALNREPQKDQKRESTKLIFMEICNYLSPNPDSLEEALVAASVSQTITEIISADGFDPDSLDIFDKNLLKTLISNFIKNYVYNKLIHQLGHSAIAKSKNDREIRKLEKDMKDYIGGVVDGVVVNCLKDDNYKEKVGELIDTLYESTYKIMEDMQ